MSAPRTSARWFPESSRTCPTERVEEIVRKLIALSILVLALACKNETAPVSAAVVEPKVAADAGVAVTEQQKAAFPRMIVRTANVKIVVADTAKTVDAITQSVEAQGGYVAGSH